MPKPGEVIEGVANTGAVVDGDGVEPLDARAVPHRHDRHLALAEVVDQHRLFAEISEEQDRVALARLEDGCQGERLVGARAGMPQH